MKPTRIAKLSGIVAFLVGVGITIAGNVLLEIHTSVVDPIGLALRSLGMMTMCGGLGLFLVTSVSERGAFPDVVFPRFRFRERIVLMNGPTYSDGDVEKLPRQNLRLTVLSLEGSQVTDICLSYVKQMKRLEHLNLRNTRITDLGLTHLDGHTRLRHLILEGTGVTDRGISLLQTMLPSCESVN